MGLALALLTFLVLGWWHSETFIVWSEETMAHSSPASAMLASEPGEDGTLRFEPSCASPAAPFVYFSDDRPRMVVCAFGRGWPVAIAPYLSGVSYWPSTLALPLHHGNVFVLRKLALGLALLSILLTWCVTRRVGGSRLAMLVAWCTAVCPIFVASHSTLVHFETMPWLWLMAGVLPLMQAPSLAPGSSEQRVPTRRLLWAALCLGVAIASNLKQSLLVAPMVLVALRFGVPFRRIRLTQWLGSLAVLSVPFLPLAFHFLAPADGYNDRASHWQEALVRHITQPERVVPFTHELLLYWSNTADFLAREFGESHANPVAMAFAAVAFAYVVIEATRVVWRGKGSAITAFVGVSVVTHLAMASLLYDSFPANFTLLHTVFAAAVAVTLDRVAGWRAIADKRALSGALAAVVLVTFGASCVITVRMMTNAAYPSNAAVQKDLAAYLLSLHEPDTVHVNTEEGLTRVLESLSDETISTLQAQRFLHQCSRQDEDPSDCFVERFRLLLTAHAERPMRFVFPIYLTIGEDNDADLLPFLDAAAASLRREVSTERSFATPEGKTVLLIRRVQAALDAT